jgi:hypothetical protein
MRTLVRVVCVLGMMVAVGCLSTDNSLRAGELSEPVLLFGIGMHIEPLGRTAQGYGGGGG